MLSMLLRYVEWYLFVFCVMTFRVFLLYTVALKITKQRWLTVNQRVTSAWFETALLSWQPDADLNLP